MSGPSITLDVGSQNMVSLVLNPGFKGVPDTQTLAKYLLNALLTISRNKLDVRLYVTKDVSAKIGNLLLSMGVKIRTIPADKMTPPYIMLTSEDGNLLLKTVDQDGKEIASYRVPLAKFVEDLEEYYSRLKEKRTAGRKDKQKKGEVDEIILSETELLKYVEDLEEKDS